MSNQPPYSDYPPQNQPWPEQPAEPYPTNYGQEQPSAYPPPPSYGSAPYPQPYPQSYPQPYPQQPMAPVYGPPVVYVQPEMYPAVPEEPGSGQAVAGMVLGIISVVFAFIPCLGFVSLVTGIIGLVMGIMGRKAVSRHGMAVAGIVLSSIGIGLSVIFFFIWIGLNMLPFLVPTQ